MERTVWTDERVDDAMARIDQRFDRVDRDLDRIFEELREIRGGVAASNRLVAQVGWTLAGLFIVQAIASIVAS